MLKCIERWAFNTGARMWKGHGATAWEVRLIGRCMVYLAGTSIRMRIWVLGRY